MLTEMAGTVIRVFDRLPKIRFHASDPWTSSATPAEEGNEDPSCWVRWFLGRNAALQRVHFSPHPECRPHGPGMCSLPLLSIPLRRRGTSRPCRVAVRRAA